MTFLLHQPEPGTPLRPDTDGWVEVRAVTEAVSELLAVELKGDDILTVVHEARIERFELRGQLIRSTRRPRPPRMPAVPDILFHATTTDRVDQVRREGVLRHGKDRPVFFSATEVQAWRAAHRLRGRGAPMVMYIDAARARRKGMRFRKHRRNGLYAANSVPAEHVLNLHENFAHQYAAGGMPIRLDPDGQVRMALIRVTRRSGITWEVAKGKLEQGEVPERAAVREVQEEMGVSCDLRVVHHLGDIRYGFVAPGSLVRLKTVFLYLMIPQGPMTCFDPSTREGIGEVAWFTPDEAVLAVTHSSLIPQVRAARQLLCDPARVQQLFRER